MKEVLIHSIKEKNKNRNYEILKNANRQRFNSVNDRFRKAQILEDKIAKADARRALLISERIQKAYHLTIGYCPKREQEIVAQQAPLEIKVEVAPKIEVVEPVEKKVSVK